MKKRNITFGAFLITSLISATSHASHDDMLDVQGKKTETSNAVDLDTLGEEEILQLVYKTLEEKVHPNDEFLSIKNYTDDFSLYCDLSEDLGEKIFELGFVEINDFLQEKFLHLLSSKKTGLKHLTLDSIAKEDILIQLSQCAKLESFNLDRVLHGEHDDRDIFPFIGGLGNLRTLKLSLVTGASRSWNALTHLVNLENLDLEACDLSHVNFNFLRSMPKLKTLKMSHEGSPMDPRVLSANHLMNLVNLEKLCLENFDLSQMNFDFLRHMPKLKTFAMHVSLLQGMPNTLAWDVPSLRSLTLFIDGDFEYHLPENTENDRFHFNITGELTSLGIFGQAKEVRLSFSTTGLLKPENIILGPNTQIERGFLAVDCHGLTDEEMLRSFVGFEGFMRNQTCIGFSHIDNTRGDEKIGDKLKSCV